MRKAGLLGLLLLVGIAGCGGSSGSSSSNAVSSGHQFPSGGNYPEGIGIDASDNIWIANQYTNSLVEMSNSGRILNTITVGGRPHGLKIDRGNTENIWVQNTAGGGPGAPASCPNSTTGTMTAFTSAGTLIGTFCTNGNQPQHAQFDANGNVWVTNQGSNTVAELTGAGVFVNSFPTGVNPHAIAIDQQGNFWAGNYSGASVTVLSPTGTNLTTIAAGQQPSGNAIDSGGNLWQSIQGLDTVAAFAAAPSFAFILSADVGFQPRGVTIDGADNVFVANQNSNSVMQFNTSGTLLKTFRVGGCPENMAVDSSGNLWVTNACSNTVSFLKGVAVPNPNGDSDSNG